MTNRQQALLVPGLSIKPVSSLRDIYLDLSDQLTIKALSTGTKPIAQTKQPAISLDFSEIIGQALAKRALEIAAAGHHNILLHGPPGTGKTMLARAMCDILPPLEPSEILEVTHLHSLAGNGLGDIITQRPFRAPHHTASTTALVGGGSNPKPGEASLAHRGVLFLDEIPEFSHSALEALRQPLEDGRVSIARVRESITYPAEFILVATQNPCPCGHFGTNKACRCSAGAIEKYQKKVSGPILDRIDLHLQVAEVDHQKLLDNKERSPESPAICQRIGQTFERQKQRYGRALFNGRLTNRQIRELAGLTTAAKLLLDQAAQKLELSARAYVRCVKVARTIADLAAEGSIEPKHIAEALQYRQPVSYL